MNYFQLNPQGWMVTLFILFAVALFIYLCIKDEKDYRKGLKKRPEPDHSSARTRYEQADKIEQERLAKAYLQRHNDDRAYNELLIKELRKPSFDIKKDPTCIAGEEMIFMN